MRLLLLRHGATEATERHLYCGSTDLPLSEAGRQALRQLCCPKMERHCTSGMARTNETMQLCYPGVAYERIPALREMDFGQFEMKDYLTLRQDAAYQAWITGDNAANCCPGGESGNQALRRAMEALGQIVEAGRDCAVVTHGGVIAGAMAAWFPQTGRNRYQWQSGPGQGYLIEFSGNFPTSYECFPKR